MRCLFTNLYLWIVLASAWFPRVKTQMTKISSDFAIQEWTTGLLGPTVLYPKGHLQNAEQFALRSEVPRLLVVMANVAADAVLEAGPKPSAPALPLVNCPCGWLQSPACIFREAECTMFRVASFCSPPSIHIFPLSLQNTINPPHVSLQRRPTRPVILLCYSNKPALRAVGAAHLFRLFADPGKVHEGAHEHSKVCLSNCPFMS